MKKIITVVALLLATSLFANNDGKNKSMSFEEVQEKILLKIDKRMQFIQAQKECIQNSKNKKDLKKCRNIMKEQREIRKNS